MKNSQTNDKSIIDCDIRSEQIKYVIENVCFKHWIPWNFRVAQGVGILKALLSNWRTFSTDWSK